MTRIVRARVTTTNSATTAMTMSAIKDCLLFHDERGRARNLHDVDGSPHFDDGTVHERARRPLLAADLHAAAAGVDTARHDRLATDERGCARARERGNVQVRARDRTEVSEREPGADQKRDHRRERAAERGCHRAGAGGERDGAEEEHPRREDLADRKRDGYDQPDDPAHDYGL